MSYVTSFWLNLYVGLRNLFASDDTELLPHLVSERAMNSPIADKRRLLKIKLKSLAAEAAIIRKEEEKAKHSKRPEVMQLREEMHEHRVKDLREESRATLLAYSYIRGKAYRDIEGRSDWSPHPSTGLACERAWVTRKNSAEAMISKYGHTRVNLNEWLSAEPNRPIKPRKPKVPYRGPKGPMVVAVQLADGSTIGVKSTG